MKTQARSEPCADCPLAAEGSDLACHGVVAPALCGRDDLRRAARRITLERAGRWPKSTRPVRPSAPATIRPRPTFVTMTGPRRDGPPGRLRVGMWAPALWLGGAESWMLSLARSVDAGRIEWTGLAVTEGRRNTVPSLVDRFAELMPVEFGVEGARAGAARSDIIVMWAIEDVPTFLGEVSPRPKVVAVSHSPKESPWAMKVYRNPIGIDAFVAVSELAIPPIPESHRGDAKVIANAVDPGRLVAKRNRAEMRKSWGVPDSAYVVGYLGRLSSEKDPGAMTRVVEHLSKDCHVVVVGDGLDGDEVRKATHPRFHAVGGDPDAGSVLNAFDTLVVPSHYESFGLSIAEGLWAGVPTISTPVGIAKLTPGLTRPIPVRASGQELAEAVRADREDVASTRFRVDAARHWALSHLNPDRFGAEWTSFLLGLVPETVKPAALRSPSKRTPHLVRLQLAKSCPLGTPLTGCGCSVGSLRTCLKKGAEQPIPTTLGECIACIGRGDDKDGG